MVNKEESAAGSQRWKGEGRRKEEQRERQEKKRARYSMVRERENQGGGRISRCEVRRETKEKGGSEERLYKGEKESKREYAKMTKGQKV